MNNTALLAASALLVTLLTTHAKATEFELSGKLGVEGRYYFQQGAYPEQSATSNLSVVIEPELYWHWNNDRDSLLFKPYWRVDQQDPERTHVDIREFAWNHVGSDWELRTGVRKVYWGVTEFQHLVDVINQTDAVEDVDGEDKLGQPMINLSLVRDWGIVDIFVLPGFRERTFSGANGRMRSSVVIATDQANYQASAGQQHIDYALRWTTSIDRFDIGSYWFHGTNRDPLLKPDPLANSQARLVPYYQLMDQFGLDLQATVGDWLWKFEAIYRNTDTEQFWATQSGVEYTQIGVFDSVLDVGILLEYGWDARGEQLGVSGQNDVFIGTRWAFNDAQSSEFLLGAGFDLQHSAHSLMFEASRRLGDSYKISLDARWFSSASTKDLLSQIAQDDHVQLTLAHYF